VRGVSAAAPLRVAEVYPALGVRPICGKCAPMVRDILRSTEVARPVGLTEGCAPA